MTDEVWKPVPHPEYEDRYSVSNKGRVRREAYSVDMPKPGNHDGTYTRTYEPKLMSQWDTGGYRTVNLARNSEHTTFYVHRLVLKAFMGKPPTEDHECNHIDGDKTNNALSNLEWTTRQANMQHANENGLLSTGFKDTKIPDDQIPVLRERYETEDVTQKELAEKWGVGANYVCQLLNGYAGRAAA